MSNEDEQLGQRLTAEFYDAIQHKEMDRVEAMLGDAVQQVGMSGSLSRSGLVDVIRGSEIDPATVANRDFRVSRDGDLLVVS